MTLKNKYLDACFVGDVSTVEYMIKNEGKQLKSFNFLVECLKRACEGSNDSENSNDSKDNHIKVCKIILQCIKTNINICHNDLISHACLSGKLNFVKYYLDTLQHDKFPVRWVYESCESGNIELIKFITKKADEHSVGWNPDTCLKYACESGNIECVNFFINFGNQRTVILRTVWEDCLTMACQSGNLEIVKLVIEKGALGYSSNIMQAAFGGNVNIIKLLLEKIKDKKGLPTIEYIECIKWACYGGHLEVIKFIIEENLNKDHISIEHWLMNCVESCMVKACELGKLEIIKYMIEKGARNWNRYALIACSYSNSKDNVEIIKFMIKKGANDFNTYLPHACMHGHLDYVHELIKKGATNWDGGLQSACYGNHPKIARLMIECGAYRLNSNLLSICSLPDSVDLCNILISGGADDLDCLSETSDFQLHCRWLKFKNMKCNRSDTKWMKLIEEHPPFVLLIGSLCSWDNKCHTKKLPAELFTLLTQY